MPITYCRTMAAYRAKHTRGRTPPPGKALELDGSLAHPHAVLGSDEMEYDWDFPRGEAEYQKAFQLDANDATAHQWYAEDISFIGDREQEAIAEIDRAHQLDPVSAIISEEQGYVRLMARHYDEAIVICEKVSLENPTFETRMRASGGSTSPIRSAI